MREHQFETRKEKLILDSLHVLERGENSVLFLDLGRWVSRKGREVMHKKVIMMVKDNEEWQIKAEVSLRTNECLKLNEEAKKEIEKITGIMAKESKKCKRKLQKCFAECNHCTENTGNCWQVCIWNCQDSYVECSGEKLPCALRELPMNDGFCD